MKKSIEERLDQLTALGCTTFTDANDISQRCNTMPGQYLGTRIYAYRNLVFDGHIVNVYRRIDSRGRVRDFRLLAIEPGATQQENQTSETTILGSMQLSSTKGENNLKIDGPDNLGNSSPPPPRYPTAKGFLRSIKRHADEFTKRGFIIRDGALDLLSQCEAKVNNVEEVNIVPLTTTAETSFHVAWITRNNKTVGLPVQLEDENLQKFEGRANEFKARSAARTKNPPTFRI
jgi:hypothetical protein